VLTGKIKTNASYGRMILAEDGRWFSLPEGCSFELETEVTFDEWTVPGIKPPPGLYRATDVKEKKKASVWNGTFRPSFSQEDVARMNLAASPSSTPAATSNPTRQAPTRVINDSIAQSDYQQIMAALDRMTWEGSYGPSVRVETKLHRNNPAAVELYQKIKEDLHDKPISGLRLYYYVTGLGVSWGKAGFRITGHTKPSNKIANSSTHGVLHVENN